MKHLSIFLFLWWTSLVFVPEIIKGEFPEPPILIELFTSQACSSCPPADRVLAKLTEEGTSGNLNVITLSYHVDYWNQLGWKDPYSNAIYSHRQRFYASKFEGKRVYTPQIVVNGRTGHIGSRESEVRQAISEAVQSLKAIPFTLYLEDRKNGMAQIAFRFEQEPQGYYLQVALVDDVLENEVTRGENQGRHLKHVRVVRSFKTLDSPSSSGSFWVDLAALDHPESGRLVVFLQHKETWAIHGVRELSW